MAQGMPNGPVVVQAPMPLSPITSSTVLRAVRSMETAVGKSVRREVEMLLAKFARMKLTSSGVSEVVS